MRLIKVFFMTIALAFVPKTMLASIPILDTIKFDVHDIEGRWIETNNDGENKTHIFREDGTYHQANNTEELLLFNIAGMYRLMNDTIRVVYQDFSRSSESKTTTMYLQIIALSEDELSINKSINNKVSFMRLKRQNKKGR